MSTEGQVFEETLERLSYQYPPEITSSERVKIDEARSAIADAMVIAYASFMGTLTDETKSGIRKSFASGDALGKPYGFTVVQMGNEQRTKSRLAKPDNYTLSEFYDAATFTHCFTASLRTLTQLAVKNPNDFDQLYMIRGDYDNTHPLKLAHHSYFVARLNLGEREKNWYFAGSPANSRLNSDALQIFEGATLDTVLNEVRAKEGLVIPSAAEVNIAFAQNEYRPFVVSEVDSTPTLMLPECYVVRKNADGEISGTYGKSLVAFYMGEQTFKKI